MPKIILVLLTGWMLMTGLALAQAPETAMIEKLFGTEAVDEADFAPAFLAAVPMAQIRGILDPLRAAIGPVTAVEPSGKDFNVLTATHRVRVSITLGSDGRIVALLLQPPQLLSASLEEALIPVAGIGARQSYIIVRDGAVIAARNADERLAVGSTYKLGILKVIRDKIEAGALAWDQVLRLAPEDRSLPSSLILSWPDDSPFTLHTLAGLMISQSDNTATDMLLDLAGRDAVSRAIGGFAYKTREIFTIKADPDLAARFRAADDAGKTALAEGLRGAPLPDAVKASVPLTEGIEWYLSARELCALIETVADLDVMAINPGLSDPDAWARAAFKGGSEIGVLNLTHHLTGKDGARYCVSMTWNDDKAIDDRAAFGVYNGVVAKLAE